MRAKKRTLGYFPTVDGKPAKWCEWKDEKTGKTEGQICYGMKGVPLVPTRDKVRNQIRRTLTFRRRHGYDKNENPGRYGIQRVIA